MSLITRAQTARNMASELAVSGPGWFGRRERATLTAIRQFADRARSIPDNADIPDVDRQEIQTLIAVTIQSIEGYIARPGDRSATKRSQADRELVKAIYALQEADERVSQRRHPVV